MPATAELRTKQRTHGTVTVTSDGTTWTVTTGRAGTPIAGGGSSSGTTDSGSTATEAPEEDTAPSSGSCAAGQVDINSGGFDALQQIIHIGPDRAGQIPGLRPFASVRSMDRISGIGPARLEDIIAEGVACVG